MRPPGRTSLTLAACFLASTALALSPLPAQRLYRLEVSGAGAYQLYDSQLELKSAFGGALRLGYWVTGPLSVEVEGTLARPRTDTPLGQSVRANLVSAWLLGNFPIGNSAFALLKAGYGHLGFGTCPAVSVPGSGPCGSADVMQGGLGVRIGLSPTLFMRYEATVQRSLTTLKFSNVSLQGGVSLMLGSRPLIDSDGDGVYDRRDGCAETRLGALVDERGCPTDRDSDGVPDGIDRCPNTLEGATADQVGCTTDTDADGYLDGLDQCPDTPVGALVDGSGCPSDADRDGVFDGLDRCQATPLGATVDALGCPGDADGDSVLDGLDRCPDTRRGLAVDATGCPTAPEPPPLPAGPVEFRLPGTVFEFRQAILSPEAHPVLDSVVALLQADTAATAEVAGYAHDRLVPADNTRLSQRRADAVREYILGRGVPVTRVTAVGRGSQSLVVSDTTDVARTANRRVEIRVTRNP